MTIKQYGGVFGRNPTFNDVTIEGQLTFDGDIDINSDLKVSGDIETTGNVIIATSGKGIDFSATAGTGTSELLDDYEEGDFSVTSSTAEIVLNANTCKYTKVGRKVTCSGAISVASIGAPTGNVDFGGFPFTSANVDGADISVDIYTYGWKTSMTTSVMGAMSRNASGFYVQKTNGAGSVAVLSGDIQAGTVIWFSVSYIVA